LIRFSAIELPHSSISRRRRNGHVGLEEEKQTKKKKGDEGRWKDVRGQRRFFL
jgi:hypothetical protein